MAKKDEFKEFVRKNPKLISYVKKGEMDWQKFYEIYDLYGEEESAWNDYLSKEETVKAAATGVATGLGFSDIINFIKNIDLDSVQEGVNSVQRVLGVFQDFNNKDNNTPKKEEYKPRPLYKHFED